jgi:hypothetical protein
MKTTTLIFFAVCIAFSSVFSQSKTTEALHKNNDAQAFFFYNNTLRMLNQTEDKSFDELIKNIEKMKLLLISKPASFGAAQYKKIVADYKSESFEEAMTSRLEGKSFDIFIKEKDNKTKGMLVLVNDKDKLYVLDIVGSIALDQVGNLYKTIENSSDIKKVIGDLGKNSEKKD